MDARLILDKTTAGQEIISRFTTTYQWPRTARQIFLLASPGHQFQDIGRLLNKPVHELEPYAMWLLESRLVYTREKKGVIYMDVKDLKASYDLIGPNESDKMAFAEEFYHDKLFRHYPETAILFANTSWERQYRSLMGTIATVIAGIEAGANLGPTLTTMGRKHAGKGVQASHYPMVGECLVATFHARLGSRFTPEMHNSWIEAFSTIATAMIAGSKAESPDR